MIEKEMELVLLEEGKQQVITSRKQREFRHRLIRCSTCSLISKFDQLPHACPDCANDFTSGKDELIPDDFWWDDSVLRNCKVLIVGCGAVGNEVVKNLALAGIMHFTLIDFDQVEESNRSRAILFNEASITESQKVTGGVAKVDVMAAALMQIDRNIQVTCINRGIPDNASVQRNEAIEKGKREGELLPLMSEVELYTLCDDHDIAIIGTDGRAPAARFNRTAYPLIPQIRGAMDEVGTVSNIALSLPYITYCLECADMNNAFGTTVRPPRHPEMYPAEEGLYDWSEWQRHTGMNVAEVDTSLGKKACFKVAEAAGAQSFAHANSVLGSQMVAQALLVLHGYPQIKENHGMWPDNVSKPLLNERLTLYTFGPGRTQVRPMVSGQYPDGMYHCGCCDIVFRGLHMANEMGAHQELGYETHEDCPRLNKDATFWKETINQNLPPPPPAIE